MSGLLVSARLVGVWRPALLLLGALALAAPATSAQPAKRDTAPLRVCLLDHDPPRAEQASGSGFDVELTARLAERLGRRHVPVWMPSGSPFSEIGESEIPVEALAEGRCDLVASVPGRAALEGLEERVELTRPYYGAAFELVPGGHPSSSEAGGLDALEDDVVAVRQQTVAHFAVHRHGLRWLSAPTTEEVLGLLESGEATVAMVWGPTAAAAGVSIDDSWQPPSDLCWNLHLAVRTDDTGLAEAVDRALGELLEEGVVAELAARFGLTREPFDEVFAP